MDPCEELTQITGAPIDRDPVADNLADAGDVNKVNDFDYSDDTTQVRCPFTSHLRKVSFFPSASRHFEGRDPPLVFFSFRN